jgi:hypothetical protein
MERTIADAVGRATGLTLRAMLRADALGLRPERVHAELRAEHSASWVEAPASRHLWVRHTVGGLDPITGPSRLGDGLPETLEQYVAAHGLRYFKLKLGGDVAADIDRLQAIAALLDHIPDAYGATLDGNEQYRSLDSLAEFTARLGEAPSLARLRASLQFIEQPLDRRVALDPSAGKVIHRIAESFPLLIDESDDEPMAFARALDLGYAGVSTKNCKGIVKSFVNRSLVASRSERGMPAFMSAEDLTNLPVVPLQQDLATVAVLGIGHVERNGHHYVRGLGHCTPADRRAALARHPDLYVEHPDGTFLRIEEGCLSVASLSVTPGYGVGFEPDLAGLMSLDAWCAQQAVA